MLIDTHCHLDFPELRDRLPEVIANAHARGVGGLITISTRVSQADAYRALSERYADIAFTIGTHPHNAAEEPDIAAETLVGLAAHPRCVAIGEAGLDFHYDRSPRDIQERVFRTHIDAARQSGLPLVIHARDADQAMIRILDDEMGRGRFDAVLHCFSSGAELARRGVSLGLYVSFSGILTFSRSEELRRVAAEIVPPDRLLVETDAPYLAPVPHRGRPNEPAFVRHTAEVLARTVGMGFDELAALTTANAFRLFRKLPFREHATATGEAAVP